MAPTKLESFRLPLYLQEQRPDLPDYPRPILEMKQILN